MAINLSTVLVDKITTTVRKANKATIHQMRFSQLPRLVPHTAPRESARGAEAEIVDEQAAPLVPTVAESGDIDGRRAKALVAAAIGT